MIINRTCGGGNSFQINGDIARGSVKSGNTIAEGDFVSRTAGSWGADAKTCGYDTSWSNVTELSNGKIFIFGIKVMTFVTISGNTFTSVDVNFPDQSNSDYGVYSNNLSFTALSNDRIFVTYSRYYESDESVEIVYALYQINNNNTVTLLNQKIVSVAYSGYGYLPCKLTDNKVILFETYEEKPNVTICTIENNIISIIDAGTITLSSQLLDAIPLDENTILLGTDSGINAYCRILKINGSSLNLFSNVTIFKESDYDNSTNPPLFLKLEDGKVFALETVTHDGGGDASNYGIMIYYDKNYNLTVGSATYFGNGHYRKPIRLSKYKLGFPHGTWRWTNTRFIEVELDDNDNMTVGTSITLNSDDYSGNSNVATLLNSGAIVLIHENDDVSYCVVKSADTYSKYSSGTIAGLARIDGASGSSVEVYLPK